MKGLDIGHKNVGWTRMNGIDTYFLLERLWIIRDRVWKRDMIRND